MFKAIVSRAAAAAGLALLAGVGDVRAADFPSRPVTVIVPYAAGGAGDTVVRLLAPSLEKTFGQPIVVEARAGGGGTIGARAVAEAAPDGHMLLMGAANNFVINQYMFPKVKFDPLKALAPIMRVADVPSVIYTSTKVPATTLEGFIAYAKANPGKLNCATAGLGSSVHLSAELFKVMAGVEMALVHYRGSAPSLTDLVAGNVDLVFDNIGAIISQGRSGNVKALAITKLERSPLAPEYPTVSDTLPGFETTSFVGLGVREGTPKEICEIIERDIVTIAKDNAVRDRLAKIGIELAGTSTADFSTWLDKERAKWGKLITDLKIRID